jgi:hypothetical protein
MFSDNSADAYLDALSEHGPMRDSGLTVAEQPDRPIPDPKTLGIISSAGCSQAMHSRMQTVGPPATGDVIALPVVWPVTKRSSTNVA